MPDIQEILSKRLDFCRKHGGGKTLFVTEEEFQDLHTSHNLDIAPDRSWTVFFNGVEVKLLNAKE